MLSAFDPRFPDKVINDFVVPWQADPESPFVFRGLEKGNTWSHATVVYIGKLISEHDLIERITKADLPNRESLYSLEWLAEFLAEIKTHRVGEVVRIVPGDSESRPFALEQFKLNRP
ncbi:MAG: hypothetical protein KDA68_03085 [Planctomycetaceae bacterium]|nr:hypothetical protein [Planctomycetaceae bacterium]